MYTLDTRYKALVHYEHFLPSLRKVAKLYGISKSILARWHHLKSGLPKVRTALPLRNKLKQRLDTSIREFVRLHPASQLCDIQHHIQSIFKTTKSLSSVQRYVKRAGVTRKRLTQIADAKTIQSDAYKDQRVLFQQRNIHSIISIDETCFYSSDHSRYGYALRGKRARFQVDKKRVSRFKVSLLLAVSTAGMVGFKTYVGSCGSVQFAEFIATLDIPRGSTLLMDNVAFHKTKLVKQTAETKGCTLFYTPPYSPWFNPVETVFSTLKHRFRRAISQTRSAYSLNAIILLIETNLRNCPTSESFTHVKKLLRLNPVKAQLT